MTLWLDVVTPVHGQVKLTVDMLRSLSTVQGVRWVWVDNASTDRERKAILREINRLGIEAKILLQEENLGFIQATNLGIEASDAPYVLMLNNDTRIYPGCLEAMRRALDTEHKAGCSGPVSSSGWQGVVNLHHKAPTFRKLNLPSFSDFERSKVLREHFAGRQKRIGSGKTPLSGMLAFFCAMFPRKVLKEIGPLDESFGVGFGDDDDYCERLHQAGFTLWLAMDAYCWHNHRTTFKELYSAHEIYEKQEAAMHQLKEKWNA